MSDRQRDVFVLGFSDDVRALLDHLAVEAPGFLDQRKEALAPLTARGVRGLCGDPLDLNLRLP